MWLMTHPLSAKPLLFEYALLSAKPLPAFRAFSLDDERDGVGIETFRQLEARNMDILHAERTVA